MEPASKMCFFKKLDDGQSPKKEDVSVNFSHALFRVLSTHDNLSMQTLGWLCLFWFGTSNANLS
jgi:hypothetical protein